KGKNRFVKFVQSIGHRATPQMLNGEIPATVSAHDMRYLIGSLIMELQCTTRRMYSLTGHGFDFVQDGSKKLLLSHKYVMCAIRFGCLMSTSDPVFAAMDFAPAPPCRGVFIGASDSITMTAATAFSS